MCSNFVKQIPNIQRWNKKKSTERREKMHEKEASHPQDRVSVTRQGLSLFMRGKRGKNVCLRKYVMYSKVDFVVVIVLVIVGGSRKSLER